MNRELSKWFLELAEDFTNLLGGYGLALNEDLSTNFIHGAYFFTDKDWTTVLKDMQNFCDCIIDYDNAFDEIIYDIENQKDGEYFTVRLSLWYQGQKYNNIIFNITRVSNYYSCSLYYKPE